MRPFKPEFRERWQLLEFSFSPRKPRLDQGNYRSCLENRDQIKGILDLVSMLEIEGHVFLVSSRSMRLGVRNSRSRLDMREWEGEILILVSRLKKWLSLTSGSNTYWLISSNTFKASVAIKAAGKDMGPHTALAAIGNVTERTTKHTEFSCKTWTTERSDFWGANNSESGRKSPLFA